LARQLQELDVADERRREQEERDARERLSRSFEFNAHVVDPLAVSADELSLEIASHLPDELKARAFGTTPAIAPPPGSKSASFLHAASSFQLYVADDTACAFIFFGKL
jgi:hypothetical protein